MLKAFDFCEQDEKSPGIPDIVDIGFPQIIRRVLDGQTQGISESVHIPLRKWRVDLRGLRGFSLDPGQLNEWGAGFQAWDDGRLVRWIGEDGWTGPLTGLETEPGITTARNSITQILG